jgi:hypothetical protein
MMEQIVSGRRKRMKPFEVFICHKKSSGKDYAEHLKAGLEELGYHTFLDSKDIPKLVDGHEEWVTIRDQAIKEADIFILLITAGFDLSQEVKNELRLARQIAGKRFIYFRHRDLGRKIVVDLGEERIYLGLQEQVSFESKEELLRLACGILPNGIEHKPVVVEAKPAKPVETEAVEAPLCAACQKTIVGEPHVELLAGRSYIFDSEECATTYKRLKGVYGDYLK